jgi:acyl-CoA thioesterase FadM
MFRYNFVPRHRTEKGLVIVVADPTDVLMIDELELLLGASIDVCVGTPTAIQEILKKSESSQRVLEEATEEFKIQIVTEDEETGDYEGEAGSDPLFERALGLTKFQALKTFNFAGYPLARTRARFIRPTRFGDDVTVETTVEFGLASFAIEHRLSLDRVTCVECSETRVWVVHDPAVPGRYKAHPIPEAVRAKFRA